MYPQQPDAEQCIPSGQTQRSGGGGWCTVECGVAAAAMCELSLPPTSGQAGGVCVAPWDGAWQSSVPAHPCIQLGPSQFPPGLHIPLLDNSWGRGLGSSVSPTTKFPRTSVHTEGGPLAVCSDEHPFYGDGASGALWDAWVLEHIGALEYWST